MILGTLDRSLHTFEPFSGVHLGAVVLFASLWTAVIVAARRRHEATGLRRAEILFGIVALGAWLFMVGRWLRPRYFDVAYSLPLQLCDIAALLVPLALLWRRRTLLVLLYFWGLSLSLQAVITPVLYQGIAEFEFWLFWTYHSMILATPLYFVVVRGFRPTWRDFGRAVAWSGAYLAVVLTLDVAFGFNYGFVGDSLPQQPTILDHLGPWPQRVVSVALLAVAAMALLQLPWWIARSRRQWKSQPVSKSG